MSWDVDPWGRWRLTARSAEFEAVVEATCAAPGTPLRAPTMDQGLAPFCRDSFCGQVGGCRLLIWSLTQVAMRAGMREMPPQNAAPVLTNACPSHPPCCAQARIRVWPAGKTAGPPILDCTSAGASAAVEVGGGPWFSRWQQEAEMAGPVKQLLNLPINVEALADWLPRQLRPPGL